MVKTIKMTKTQYRNFLDKFSEDLANNVLNELVRTVAVDTGNLKNSMEIRKEGNSYIIYGPEYARHVEYGTNPHVIEPKNAKALAFEWTNHKGNMLSKKGRLNAGLSKAQSNTAVFKKVQHPGTSPQPFIRPVIYHKAKNLARRSLQ